MTLTIGAKNIQLTFGDGSVLFGNAIDGKYPDWRSVLPDSTGQVTIPAAPLGNAIDMLMASDDISDKNESRINQINVCVAPTGTTLRRGETGLCEIGSETASGSTQELAFNIRFLADAVETVRTAGSSDIVIGYTSAEKAIAVRPKDRDFPLVVVMPLRP